MLLAGGALMKPPAIAHTFSGSVYVYDVPRWRKTGAAAGWLVAALLFVTYGPIPLSAIAAGRHPGGPRARSASRPSPTPKEIIARLLTNPKRAGLRVPSPPTSRRAGDRCH